MSQSQSSDTRRPPTDPYFEDLPACKNCGEAFADHLDTGDNYLCPYEHQRPPHYGGFQGGDPRNFHPDGELSGPHEIGNHRKACEEADRMVKEKKSPDLENPSSFTVGPDYTAFTDRRPFGVGVTTFPEVFYERADIES
jgi:hypothetical protein